MTIDEYADIYRAFSAEQAVRLSKTVHSNRERILTITQSIMHRMLGDTIRLAVQSPRNNTVTTLLDLQKNFSANNTFLWYVPSTRDSNSMYYRVQAPGMFDIDGDTGYINEDTLNLGGLEKVTVGFFPKRLAAVYGWDAFNNPPPKFATYQEAAAFVTSAIIVNGAANPVEGCHHDNR